MLVNNETAVRAEEKEEQGSDGYTFRASKNRQEKRAGRYRRSRQGEPREKAGHLWAIG